MCGGTNRINFAANPESILEGILRSVMVNPNASTGKRMSCKTSWALVFPQILTFGIPVRETRGGQWLKPFHGNKAIHTMLFLCFLASPEAKSGNDQRPRRVTAFVDVMVNIARKNSDRCLNGHRPEMTLVHKKFNATGQRQIHLNPGLMYFRVRIDSPRQTLKKQEKIIV